MTDQGWERSGDAPTSERHDVTDPNYTPPEDHSDPTQYHVHAGFGRSEYPIGEFEYIDNGAVGLNQNTVGLNQNAVGPNQNAVALHPPACEKIVGGDREISPRQATGEMRRLEDSHGPGGPARGCFLRLPREQGDDPS